MIGRLSIVLRNEYKKKKQNSSAIIQIKTIQITSTMYYLIQVKRFIFRFTRLRKLVNHSLIQSVETWPISIQNKIYSGIHVIVVLINRYNFDFSTNFVPISNVRVCLFCVCGCVIQTIQYQTKLFFLSTAVSNETLVITMYMLI